MCASLLVGISLHCYAGETDFATDTDAIFCGFSTGLMVGNSSTIGTLNTLTTAGLALTDIPINFDITLNKQDHLSKNSVAGTAFAGYGYNFNSVYFGAEAFLKGAQQRMVLNSFSNFVSDDASANIQRFAITKVKGLECGIDFVRVSS